MVLTLNKQFPLLTKKFLLINSARGQVCMCVSESEEAQSAILVSLQEFLVEE
jgi:hypothetical protein